LTEPVDLVGHDIGGGSATLSPVPARTAPMVAQGGPPAVAPELAAAQPAWCLALVAGLSRLSSS
jgi:hypothetical protein